MDIVLPLGPGVAMLFSLEQLRNARKMRLYSDITQAISCVLKMQLEAGHWVEFVSSSAAGGHGPPQVTKLQLSSGGWCRGDRTHLQVSCEAHCCLRQPCWPLHSKSFQAHYSIRRDPEIGSTLDVHLGFSHSLATLKSHLFGKQARDKAKSSP